jgi:hypothetical protein
VQSGLVACGFIDPQSICMPVLQKMISRCKKILFLVEYNKYLSSFESLMKLSCNNGNKYLSDHNFINHGFNPDIDAYGNKKIQYAMISQENQQRAKCLTSAAEVCT